MQAGETDIVANVLKYASILKAQPDSSKWSGFVDLIYIEDTAGGIVKSVLQGSSDGRGVEFLHHSGGKVIPAQSIKEVLSVDEKAEWAFIAISEWVDKAVEKSISPLVGAFLRSANAG